MTTADGRQKRLRQRRPRRRTGTIGCQSVLVPNRFEKAATLCSFQILLPAIARMGLLVLLAFGTNNSHATTMARAQQEITITGGSGSSSDEVCACSPSTYTFVLDFSLTCPPTNVIAGSGVASVSCLIGPFGAPTNNLVPVVVDSVSILELDQVNNVIVEKRIDGELFDGDSYLYSSVINNLEDATSVKQIPKALQLNLSARNEHGVTLMNVFIVTFTNECGVLPVFQIGESVGWAVFSQVSDPMSGFCATSPPLSIPSHEPSRRPTGSTTQKATTSTSLPTRRPAYDSSPFPTKSPTERTTDEPALKETRRPTRFQTLKPPDDSTSRPTDAPTRMFAIKPIDEAAKRPSSAPIRKPTQQSSNQPTDNPPLIRRPTHKPSSLQTKSPMLPTGSPTIFSFPTQSSVPSVFATKMSMSMPMSLSIAGDSKFSQHLEAELESMEDYYFQN
uniref:Uncharacterized protein n=1 Tax=Pseudo-nitzschia australis TaxID=44445 RepID=A0A7S4AJR4_9STRA|mmetsp:Transcript_1442/g.3167  ORF Transcript_1442/g.3167 Transcript_1442/m.3167 type:complete len:447 (-) Transcript_1442:562-1902(-)